MDSPGVVGTFSGAGMWHDATGKSVGCRIQQTNQPKGSAPLYPRRAPRLVGCVCFGALRAPLDRCTAGGHWKDQLVQLTWQSNVAFVYDRVSFAPRRTFSYSGEGWGLTSDDRRFILSDGTAQLRFLDPDTFREVGRVTVTDGGKPVRDLNELEYLRGEVYANVWHTDRIARISPQTGQVTRWIDLRGVMSGGFRLDPEAVLNGIAHDAAGDRLFVTGKLWPRLFEIQVASRK